jgi:hypothetical protein
MSRQSRRSNRYPRQASGRWFYYACCRLRPLAIDTIIEVDRDIFSFLRSHSDSRPVRRGWPLRPAVKIAEPVYACGADSTASVLDEAGRPVHHGPILPPIPANHLKGRDVRQRRRTGHQVVGVGRVYQHLRVLVATTPLRRPRPSLTGHDGGRRVSMQGPTTPDARMTHADADSTGAMSGCPIRSHLPAGSVAF